ncbi:MAG: hypothetical protein GX881_08680 [Firmicutes bacterium]|nr:hypothetical protein [Bacillota bacterium]
MFEIIDLLQGAMANPWMLLFLAIWGIGFFVKEHTPLDSSRVPWIVLPVGIALGVALIEVSLAGAIIGGVMALAQMGFYDVVKPLLGSIPPKVGEGGITVDGAGEDDEQ